MDARDIKGHYLEEVRQTHIKRRCNCVEIYYLLIYFSFFFCLSAVKPENVNLTANVTTKETCLDWVVNFTCEADANPAVHKYLLYENDTIVDMDVSGVWIRPLNKPGHVIYRCEANNSLSNEKSNSILFIVGGKDQYRVLIESTVVIFHNGFLVRFLINL